MLAQIVNKHIYLISAPILPKIIGAVNFKLDSLPRGPVA